MFTFKFEKILHIKSKLLDEKRIQIANINELINEQKRFKEVLERDNLFRREKLFRLINSKEPDMNMILFLDENITNVYDSIKAVEIRIVELKNRKKKLIYEARELLKEKKKLEKIKERKMEEYRDDVLKEEKRFLDEIVSIKVAFGRVAHS